jgi:hypothetical protein
MDTLSTMVVMLIWGGFGGGGPAVIPDFQNLLACEQAQATVEDFYRPQHLVRTKCVELPKAIRPDAERAEYERLKRKFEGP